MKLETNICDDINIEILNKMMANQAQQSTKNNKLKKKPYKSIEIAQWVKHLPHKPDDLS